MVTAPYEGVNEIIYLSNTLETSLTGILNKRIPRKGFLLKELKNTFYKLLLLKYISHIKMILIVNNQENNQYKQYKDTTFTNFY